MVPLRTGSADEFRIVREFLSEAGYTEEALRNRFGIPQLDWLFQSEGLMSEHLGRAYREPSLLTFLTRTLVGGYAVEQAEAERYLPAEVLRAFLALGVLEDDRGVLVCPVALYPSMGFFIVSDRAHGPDGPAYIEEDFVMNMAMNFSQRYVEGIGLAPCKRALEIGTGAGLGALRLSTCAEEVWATDIIPRAVHYGEFNARLNGVGNVQFVVGDLFEPVRGMTFDRIASHPPFEPAVKGNYVYSVGGEDGEELVARLVAECPRHLTPGGRAYINIAGTDRVGESLEARARKWLGSAAAGCDVALFVRISCQPMEYARELILSENKDAATLEGWTALYDRLQAELVIVGYLVLQKQRTPRETFLTRRVFGKRTGSKEMEWLLAWETRMLEPGFRNDVFASRPRSCEGWELYVRHRMRDGALNPVSYTIFTLTPFETNLYCAPWLPMLACQCDGVRSGADLFQWLRRMGPVAEEEFVRAIGALVATGVVRIDDVRIDEPGQ